MQPELDSVIDKAEELLRLPHSALRVFELTEAEDTTLDALVDAIQVDPTLVARILRLVNSPLFSRGGDITQLDRAVSILGYQEVGQIAVALAAAKEFAKIETELLRTSSFWSHSLTTAILARQVATQQGMSNRGVFVAALLHDIGLPVQFALCGNEMIDAMDMSLLEDDIDLVRAENDILGFDHTQVGAGLGEIWQLPDVIVQCARHHHEPQNAVSHNESVALVAWANIVEALGTDAEQNAIESLMPALEGIWQVLPLPLPTDVELLRGAQKEAAEMLALF